VFAVRFSTVHGKENVFTMCLVPAHGKGDECLPCAKKTHIKLFVCLVPTQKCTTNYFSRVFLFAVRCEKMRTQSSSLPCT
jgi:hypothetical protein